MFVKLFCINLQDRKDRLKRFMDINKKNIQHDIEIIDAIDGKQLDINSMKDKINPLDYLTAKEQLKGVIGCCSSHFKVLRRMVDNNIPYAIVMEDDLMLTDSLKNVEERIREFMLVGGDLLYFNYPYPKESYEPTANDRPGYKLKQYDGKLYTAEMYLISKDFAKKVLNHYENNLGAFDLMLKRTMMREGGRLFVMEPPIADQFDRNDSNIRNV